jgi:hypothetical protein
MRSKASSQAARRGWRRRSARIVFSARSGLQAAIFAALRVRDGKTVVGEGSPARWRLKEIAD